MPNFKQILRSLLGMPAVADKPGRKLTFGDVQLIMTAVRPSDPSQGWVAKETDSQVLEYIQGLDAALAKDIESSSRDETCPYNQDIRLIAQARELYGSLSAYNDLQNKVI